MRLNTILLRFKKVIDKNPRLSNTIIYGSTGTFGAELFQQTMIRKVLVEDGKRKEYDWGSLGRYWVAGFLIFPHVFWYWYKALDRMFPGRGAMTAVKKILMDQIVSPAPILVLFYASMSLMEGKKDILEECNSKLATTLQMRYLFMLPAAAINFSVIPTNLRVSWQGLTTFFWVNVLCYLKRLDIKDEAFQQPSSSTSPKSSLSSPNCLNSAPAPATVEPDTSLNTIRY